MTWKPAHHVRALSLLYCPWIKTEYEYFIFCTLFMPSFIGSFLIFSDRFTRMSWNMMIKVSLFPFFKKNWRISVLFVGSLIPLFLDSGDVSSGFQSQGGSLACVLRYLRTMDPWYLWYVGRIFSLNVKCFCFWNFMVEKVAFGMYGLRRTLTWTLENL